MDKPLLYDSSLIFDHADLADCIHQSCINVNQNSDLESVQILVNEAINYLDGYTSVILSDELFSLLLTCFSYFPEPLLPIFTTFFEKSRLNSNHIITTVTILSYYIHNQSELQSKLPDYLPFVNDALNEIRPQVKNTEKTAILVFTHEIPSQLSLDFILKLLLCAKLTKELISDFIPYIFKSDRIINDSNFTLFIKELSKKDLISTFPPTIPSDFDIITKYSYENMSYFIPYISDQIFIQFSSQIENFLTKPEKLTSTFITNLIHKCSQNNIKLKNIIKIFDVLKPSEFSHEICTYLQQYQFVLSEEKAKKIAKIPDIDLLLDFIPNIKIFSDEDLFRILLKKTKIEKVDFSTSEFYIKLYSILNNESFTFNLFEIICRLFEKFVQKENAVKFLDEMIFSFYPPTKNGSDFLCFFFKEIDTDIFHLFYSKEHMIEFINKIIEKKVIPSRFFVEILDKKVAYEMIQKKENLNYNLFFFLFFHLEENDEMIELNEITVGSIDANDEKLIDLINNGNFESMVNLNIENLAFVSSCLIFLTHGEKNVIKGLTKESVLPFYALTTQYIKKFKIGKKIDTISSSEMLSFLIEGIKFLSNNKSPIIIHSIDTIIKSLIFSDEFKSRILQILYEYLLKGEYFADKTVLLLQILSDELFEYDKVNLIKYIIGHLSEINVKQYPILFVLNDVEIENISGLFESYFKNQSLPVSELTDIFYFYQKSIQYKPCIELEDPTNILRIFDAMVDSENWEELETICEMICEFDFESELHKRILEKVPNDKQFKFLSHLSEDELDENEIISIITKSSDPERIDIFFEVLILRMMEKKANMIGHLISKCENISDKLPLSVNDFLNLFYDYYDRDKSLLFEAIKKIFILHPTENVFVLNPDYKSFDFPDIVEYNEKIISSLFNIIKMNPDNYQAFVCLKNIALTFPFIFSSNPQRIFDIVMPFLDNFYLIFESYKDEDKEMNRITKVKTSISAFSFLFSSLCSTKIVDSFILWYFKNYESFSNSQIYCFNLIILALLNAHEDSMIPLMIDHNYFDIVSYMLNREVPKGLFGKNYNFVIYGILINFHSILIKSMKSSTFFFDSYFNIGYNFTYDNSNFFTISHNPMFFKKYSKYLSFDHEILDENLPLEWFINNLEKVQDYWFFSFSIINDDDEEEKYDVDDFINEYKKSIKESEIVVDNSPLPQIPGNPTFKMIRYLAKLPKWIFMYFIQMKKFPLLASHHKILEETISFLSKISQTGKLTDDDTTEDRIIGRNNNINNSRIMKHILFNINFLKAVYNKVESKNNEPFHNLSDFFSVLCANPNNLCWIILKFANEIDQINNDLILTEDVIYKLNNIITIFADILDQLFSRMSNNQPFFVNLIEFFFNRCGNKFIDFILQPRVRVNTKILNSAFKLLYAFKFNLPIQVSHVIGFMFLTKDELCIKNGIQLLSAFDYKQMNHMEIIQDVFDNELESEIPNFSIISSFIKYYPSVAQARMKTLMETLVEYLYKYQLMLKEKVPNNEETFSPQNNRNLNENNNNSNENENNENEDLFLNPVIFNNSNIKDNLEENELDKLTDFIILLLDFISPPRDLKKSFKMSDSIQSFHHKQNPGYLFYPIPSHIYDSSPVFWKFFDKHRPLINFILLKKFKKNKFPNPYSDDIQSILNQQKIPHFSSKLVTNYPECFSFEFRSTYFRQKMQKRINIKKMTKLKIDKDNILKSSFDQLFQLPIENWLNLFFIEYIGDKGVDYGGLTKHWFTKLSEELFNPKSDLFECIETNENYIIKHSKCDQISLQMYKFTGMIIARALIQGELFPAHLTKSFLKLILHHEVDLSDLEDADQIKFNSLKFYLKNKIDSIPDFETYFALEDEEHNLIPLKENGESIRVTDMNKKEYVDLVAKYHLKKSIIQKVDVFCEGFDELIPHEDIRIFTPNELCLLICGVPKIDVDDLMKNVCIVKPYSEKTPVVKMLFNVLKKWDNDNLSKLLFFITGSTRMPSIGFKFFVDKNLPITIQPGGTRDRMPAVHLCYNTLDLPQYENEEELNDKLLYAIQNSASFDLI